MRKLPCVGMGRVWYSDIPQSQDLTGRCSIGGTMWKQKTPAMVIAERFLEEQQARESAEARFRTTLKLARLQVRQTLNRLEYEDEEDA